MRARIKLMVALVALVAMPSLAKTSKAETDDSDSSASIAGPWKLEVKTDDFDGSTSVLASNTLFSGASFSSISANCINRSFGVALVSEGHARPVAGNDVVIQVKFDKDPPEDIRLAASIRGIMLVGDEHEEYIARRWMESREFTFRYTSVLFSNVTITHDTSGARRAIEQVLSACGLPLEPDHVDKGGSSSGSQGSP